MGAKKDKHLAILTYKEDKCKELVKAFKKFGISQLKIDWMEAKETKYKNWKAEILAKPDH